MPSHGPRSKQLTTLGDGSQLSLASPAIETASSPHNVMCAYSTNTVVNSRCNAVGQSTVLALRNNLGVHHSFLRGYQNSRTTSGGDLPNAPVYHEKITGVVSPLVPWKTTNCGGFGNQIATPLGDWRPGLEVSMFRGAIEIPPAASIRPLCDEAFNRFHTAFPEELSIANFIWELREIGSLIPQLSKSIRKSIAGGYLNLEFGWKPLIGDIKTMLGALDRLEARLRYLKSRYKKFTTTGFSRDIPYSPLWAVGTSRENGPSNGNGLVLKYTLSSYSARFSAGGRLYHTMEALDEFSGGVQALLYTFGFGNPTKIVWNMIPYSFVLGWFSNVEALIDRWANLQSLNTDWRVDRLTHSVKVRSAVHVDQLNKSGSGNLLWSQPRGSYQCEVYQRNLGLSVSDSILTLSSPSTKQSALLAALVAGRN